MVPFVVHAVVPSLTHRVPLEEDTVGIEAAAETTVVGIEEEVEAIVEIVDEVVVGGEEGMVVVALQSLCSSKYHAVFRPSSHAYAVQQ